MSYRRDWIPAFAGMTSSDVCGGVFVPEVVTPVEAGV
jgi:hypothetical protein